MRGKYQSLAWVLACLLVAPLAAQAELLQIRYTAVSGSERVQTPAAKTYSNPTGDVYFTLNAGLDRRLRIEIQDTESRVVSDATSHQIGAEDRITLGGKTYYAVDMPLPAPAEGNYVLSAQILDSSGTIIQEDRYPWIIDTTPPAYGKWRLTNTVFTKPYGWNTGSSTWHAGYEEHNVIQLTGVKDLNGIADAYAVSYYADGAEKSQEAGRIELRYSEANEFLDGGNLRDLFPADQQRDYRMEWRVRDAAGNETAISQSLFFDKYNGLPDVPAAIYKRGSTQNYLGQAEFVPFTAGMVTNENPVTVIWRLPRNNWSETAKGGLIFTGDHSVVGGDSTTVYVKITCVIGDDRSCGRVRDQTEYSYTHMERAIPVTLGPEATVTPKLLSVEYNYSDTGWGSDDRVVKSSALPVTINGIRIRIEPRNYVQRVAIKGYENQYYCDLNPGQSVCHVNWTYTMNPATLGYIHGCCQNQGIPVGYTGEPMPVSLLSAAYSYKTDDPRFRSTLVYPGITWNDRHKPQLVSYTNPEPQLLEALIRFPANGGLQHRIGAGGYAAEAGDQRITGTQTSITGDGVDRTVLFDFSSLPDGEYPVRLDMWNRHESHVIKSVGTISVDNTPPELWIEQGSGAEGEGTLATLDLIKIRLTDQRDPAPTITAINLQGGPVDDNINLGWRKEAGYFALEYPIMFPSLKDGEEYTLNITAEDAHGNTVEKSVFFEYRPRQVVLSDGMDDEVMIPAVAHEFVYADGSRIIETEPLTLGDGAVVQGTYDVLATLRRDAQVPLVVNGVRIEPGETMRVMSQHDFSASGGRLSIPVRPAVSGVVGTSSLLVMTTAPNAPILMMDISTWKASAKLSSEAWKVRQIIDPVRISAIPEADVPCRFTTDDDEARSADPIRDPVCYFQWNRLPDGVEPISYSRENSEAHLPGLVGQAGSQGEQPIEYSLYMYSGDGTRVKVGQGSRKLTVLSAYGSVAYSPAEDVAEVTRAIEDFEVRLKQTLGPECSLTLDAGRVKQEAASKPADSSSLSCLLEWQQVPDGLMQDPYSETPLLAGALPEKGMLSLGWRVSIFTRDGKRVTLAEQTFDIEAVDPPAPVVSLSSQYAFKDNLYLVPMLGGYLGDASITSERADLDVAIKRNDVEIESEIFPPGWGEANNVYRRIRTDERALWEETLYTVKAAYTRVPDVKTEAVYKAIAIPSYSIKPVIEVATDTAIDTQKLPIKVLIRNQYRPDNGYDVDKMGNWKVRLIRQKSYGETEVIADYVEAIDGEARFNLDISDVDATSMRIMAEAVLESPIEGYSRVEQSTRPTFFTVLRGGAIGADVTAARLSGEAPFTSVFKLDLHDRQDFRAVGEVVWEISSDGGGTWGAFIPEERYKLQLVKTFDKGKYRVRAKIMNRNSGAIAYTEMVEVIAYDKPEVEVAGPFTLFVGSEGVYTAKVAADGEAVPAEQAVIEWSTDAGDTYSQTGPSISLVRDVDTRVRLWVRVRSAMAPADDRYAYEVVKAAVQFREVRAPRVRVFGPSLLETGKTYIFKASTTLPYRNMDAQVKGFFTLPDGSIVEGDTAEYVPAEADLAKVRVEITYTAWIEGYREQSTETMSTHRARVWQYVWPKFGMYLRRTADVAPATIVARVRELAFRGKLEEPTYEWTLPEGAVVQDKRNPTVRSFALNEAGEYVLKVVVQDARGHKATLEEPISIGQAEPYHVDLQYSSSNPYKREPLDVVLRPYILGGHPRDRIVDRIYTLDDELLESSGYYGHATLDAGDHVLKLHIKSEMGKEAEGQVRVQVAENQLPTCSLRFRETIGSWIVYADCEDRDGRMVSYEWRVDGEAQSISSSRITISKGRYEGMPEVIMIGVDDSGGRAESATLH